MEKKNIKFIFIIILIILICVLSSILIDKSDTIETSNEVVSTKKIEWGEW